MKKGVLGLAVMAFGLASLLYWVPARADTRAELGGCSAPPPAKGKSRQRFDSQSLMTIALELQAQGEANFHLKFDDPRSPCVVEEFQTEAANVKAIYSPFQKGTSTLLYRFRLTRTSGISDVLVLYSGIAGFFSNKGFVFHVSEERDGVISWYAMYQEEPTYASVRALVTEVASGNAKPLLAVRWPPGAKEGQVVAYDSKRLK